MKIGLDVGERMIAIGVLPREGNIVTLKIIRDLKTRLGISAQEYQDFGIVQDEEKFSWNQKGMVQREFDFADVEVDLIKNCLKKLDSENKLHQDMVSVYEKFVG